jgi:hypothetical protein
MSQNSLVNDPSPAPHANDVNVANGNKRTRAKSMKVKKEMDRFLSKRTKCGEERENGKTGLRIPGDHGVAGNASLRMRR